MRALLLALLLLPLPVLAFNVDTGTYTGNATGRDITVAFTPAVCTVTGNNTQSSYFLTSTMNSDSAGAGTSWRGNQATSSSNIITNLKTNAFTIDTGANVNQTGVAYTWWCVGTTTANDFEVGKYTGNGSDNRNISLSTVTGTPKLVMVKSGGSTDTGAWRTASMSTDNSQAFHEFGAPKTNEIQDFGSGTFQVGTNGTVNTNGTVYYYIAFGDSNGISESSYTGSGATTTITVPGWTPEAVHVKANASQNLIWRTEAIGTDNSAQYSFLAYTGANNISALTSTGFTVGTNARVNAAATTYYWFALRDTVAASTPTKVPDIIIFD